MARLLVVDDDPAMLFAVRRCLRRHRPDVVVAEVASGEEAMPLLDRETFDCVLSDFRLGAVTGTDVLAYVRERQPSATRILMCGALDPAIVAEAQARAAVHACIEKPMGLEELETTIAGLADRFLAGAP